MLRLGVLVVVLTGCGDRHVTLPTLPPTMTPAQRVETFARYRVAGRLTKRPRNCVVGCESDEGEGTLVLGDGTRVSQAEDLLPLLTSDSLARTAARKLARIRPRQRWWGVAALVTFVSGTVLAIKTWNRDVLPYVGLGIGAGGPVIAGIGAWIEGDNAAVATRTVFRRYNATLAVELALCVNGLALVPCEGAEAGQATTPVLVDPAIDALRKR